MCFIRKSKIVCEYKLFNFNSSKCVNFVSEVSCQSHVRVPIYFTPIIMKRPVNLTGDTPNHNNICTYNSMLNKMLWITEILYNFENLQRTPVSSSNTELLNLYQPKYKFLFTEINYVVNFDILLRNVSVTNSTAQQFFFRSWQCLT
jgi:hypothetical protein